MVSFLEIEHLKQILHATPADKLIWRLVSVSPPTQRPVCSLCRQAVDSSKPVSGAEEPPVELLDGPVLTPLHHAVWPIMWGGRTSISQR